MKTCPYCSTNVEIMISGPYIDHAECKFCGIILGPSSEFGMYTENGNRMPHLQQHHLITEEHAKLPLPEYKKMNIMDVLLCLKIARTERAAVFSQMRIFNKAAEQAAGESQFVAESNEEYHQLKTMSDETGTDYEYWTRRCWMIENHLIERIGYFPEKVNEELYARFLKHNERSMKKPMAISKHKRSYPTGGKRK